MKLTKSIVLGVALAVGGIVCCACGSGVSDPTNATTSKTDTASMPEQGSNGAKAKNGGGMMASPTAAPPGVKTGLPK